MKIPKSYGIESQQERFRVIQPACFELQMNPTLLSLTLAEPATQITAEPIAATALETYQTVQQVNSYLNGRVNIGEIELRDRGQRWKIKVRWTAELGHFLKFEQLSGENQTFRASTRSSSAENDRLITPDEWEIFAMLVDDCRNYALRMGAQKCLGRLIHAPKAPERNAATRG